MKNKASNDLPPFSHNPVPRCTSMHDTGSIEIECIGLNPKSDATELT